MSNITEYMREWRKKNKIRSREIGRKAQAKYQKNNPTQVLESQRKYREQNREKLLEYQRNWYTQNSEVWTKWRARNPEKVRSYRARHRFLKKNNIGNFQPWMIRYYKWAQQNCCYYCGKEIVESFHLEHMIPLSRGGVHCWGNTCLSCGSCNHRKGTKTDKEFLQNE